MMPSLSPSVSFALPPRVLPSMAEEPIGDKCERQRGDKASAEGASLATVAVALGLKQNGSTR